MKNSSICSYKRMLVLAAFVFCGVQTNMALGQGLFKKKFRHCPPATEYPCCPPAMLLAPVPLTKTPEAKAKEPTKESPPPIDTLNITDMDFSPSGSIAGLGETITNPGYLYSAIPTNQLRFRYDAGYNINRPDRAEYFYAKCGCFRVAGIDPNAGGPPKAETSVDYQDFSTYMELLVGERTSVFFEAPVRFLNPEQNDNTAGFGNFSGGIKHAFISTPEQVASIQLWFGFPVGIEERGLGNGLYSIEPSLLYHRQLSELLFFDAQLGLWIPFDGSDFAGEVLNYGVGISTLLYQDIATGFRVAPVVELLGWTVLDGKAFAFPEGAILDASGNTIVNAKFGVRIGFGPLGILNNSRSSDLYLGYGRSLTGQRWYEDIFRVEYRLRF